MSTNVFERDTLSSGKKGSARQTEDKEISAAKPQLKEAVSHFGKWLD